MTLAQPTATLDVATEYATRRARVQGSRPNLRVVLPKRPVQASRGVFALFVTGLLALGLLAMLVINTSLAQGAFALSELKASLGTLNDQEAMLREQVAGYGAPEKLEASARALGMIPAGSAAFLDLEDGSVSGIARPAGGISGGALPELRVPLASIPAADAAVPDATLPDAVPPDTAAPAPGAASPAPVTEASVDASLDLGSAG